MQWYERLKFARKIKGLSLREVSKKTEISDSYLCQLENGRMKEPGFFLMTKLLKFYNLDAADIFDEDRPEKT